MAVCKLVPENFNVLLWKLCCKLVKKIREKLFEVLTLQTIVKALSLLGLLYKLSQSEWPCHAKSKKKWICAYRKLSCYLLNDSCIYIM